MKKIFFFDTEVQPKSGKVLDIGGVDVAGHTFHSNAIPELLEIFSQQEYICGHNIIYHDIPYVQKSVGKDLSGTKVVDTLFLSPLLFPAKPYHSLLKDDKLQTEELNNPVNDAIKARDLFYDEISAFNRMDEDFKQIYHALLKDRKEFASFFDFVGYAPFTDNLSRLIRKRFTDKICASAPLDSTIQTDPLGLAYSLAIIDTDSRNSITPPWVLKNYPEVERIMYLLRNNPCIEGCTYCNKALDVKLGLKRFFGYPDYRTFDGKALQEEAVTAAIHNKSILAVFPTGGGKSIAFQVPALMNGESVRGLTVIISPLQSLMKDQVDNLEKINITEAVTINGLLDPIERAKSFERVENGSASILYISPESLRSKSIERLLLGRNVVRFVIDEAHCFSSWGQDFRVDYLYIGDFIKMLQEKKNLEAGIPVSCFTATAKPNVIQDIKDYFQAKLGLSLELVLLGWKWSGTGVLQ